MPQIEVTFDIDANGILNVSAKDQGTGKEQTIEIKGGSGLSDEEVQKMVSDAESHADEDRKAKELAEARNVAEQAAYQGEKQLEELGEQVDESSKSEITAAIEDLKGVLNSTDADEIKAKTAALEAAFHKVSEQIYANAQAQGGRRAAAPTGSTNGGDPRTPRRRSWTPRSSRTSSGRPAMSEQPRATERGQPGRPSAAPVAPSPRRRSIVDAEVVEDGADAEARLGRRASPPSSTSWPRRSASATTTSSSPSAPGPTSRTTAAASPARRAEAERRGRAAVAQGLLPAIDNLERALAAAGVDPSSPAGAGEPLSAEVSARDALASGSLVLNELRGALERAGVHSYDPLGRAVRPEPARGDLDRAGRGRRAAARCVETLERGYRVDEHVIRPARVVVSG